MTLEDADPAERAVSVTPNKAASGGSGPVGNTVTVMPASIEPPSVLRVDRRAGLRRAIRMPLPSALGPTNFLRSDSRSPHKRGKRRAGITKNAIVEQPEQPLQELEN
jgi:hypothetical protein